MGFAKKVKIAKWTLLLSLLVAATLVAWGAELVNCANEIVLAIKTAAPIFFFPPIGN